MVCGVKCFVNSDLESLGRNVLCHNIKASVLMGLRVSDGQVGKGKRPLKLEN